MLNLVDHFFKILATGVNIPEKTRFLHKFSINSTDFADSLHVFFNYSSVKLHGNNNFILQIYDFSRYFEKDYAPQEYCKKANGAFIFFNCKDKNSIDIIDNYINFLQYIEKNTPIHLIGLNYNSKSMITKDMIKDYITERRIRDIEFSLVKNSKSFSNIEIYRNFCQKIYSQNKDEPTKNLLKEISSNNLYRNYSRDLLFNCFKREPRYLYPTNPNPLPLDRHIHSSK